MTLAPASVEALAAALAETSPAPLVVRGGATKRPAPDPRDGALVVDTRGLTGLVAYDPRECVVTARSGTPVADLRRALAAHGQYLPWDPPFVDEGATLGGMVASGLNGPGRLRYGGVRDFILGARVVDGRGRVVTSGGQVVKNAAGFLLHHGVVGSAGTLGVIAEVSVKVFPAPPATRTLVVHGRPGPDLLAAFARLAGAPLDLDALDLDVAGQRLAARLAGSAGALEARIGRVSDVLALPAAQVVEGDGEAALWTTLGLASWAGRRPVVKVPSTPTRVPALLHTLSTLGDCRVSAGGQVVYLAADAPLTEVSRALSGVAAFGRVVAGPSHGTDLGAVAPSAFHDRVRGALDPDLRFR